MMVPAPIALVDVAFDFEEQKDVFVEENVKINIPIDAAINSKLKGYPPMKVRVCCSAARRRYVNG